MSDLNGKGETMRNIRRELYKIAKTVDGIHKNGHRMADLALPDGVLEHVTTLLHGAICNLELMQLYDYADAEPS